MGGYRRRIMADFLGIDNLLPELIMGLGLALIVGNGLAWWKNRQGKTPEGVEDAQFRPGRVIFLLVVGFIMLGWGAISLLTL